MTRKYFALPVTLMMALGFAFTTADAIGQVTMQFVTTKDVTIRGFDSEQLDNAGGKTRGKSIRFLENAALMDFDTAAMGTFLAANPGTATWTLNIVPVEGTGSRDIPIGTPEFSIMTVESTNDWEEGDAGSSPWTLSWADNTTAATYFYAQTYQNLDVYDPNLSLEWIDPDSGPYTFLSRAPDYANNGVPTTVGGGDEFTANDPTPEFTNSAKFSYDDLETAQTNEEFASVAIDDIIINAMVNDENNRGLRFGTLDLNPNTKWELYYREFSDGIYAPYLEVSITPNAGTPGDFDNDGDVDGTDFLEWQRDTNVGSLTDWEGNFGTTNASAAVSAVPEPSTLLLLIAASSALLCVRRGNH